MSLIALVLMIGACARLTHLVTTDIITDWFRYRVEEWELNHWGSDGVSFSTLLNCPWCSGWYASFFVMALSWWVGDQDWIWWVWSALTASYVVGYAEEKL